MRRIATFIAIAAIAPAYGQDAPTDREAANSVAVAEPELPEDPATPAPILSVGGRARTQSALTLRVKQGFEPASGKLEAGTLVFLKEKALDKHGREWWRVNGAGRQGWTPAATLAALPPFSVQALAGGKAQPLAPVVRAAHDAQVARILPALESPDPRERTRALRGLAYSGVTDEVLYDEIARQLLYGIGEGKVDVETNWAAIIGGAVGGALGATIAMAATPDLSERAETTRRERAVQLRDLTWQAKALAYSGVPKYKAVLEYVAAAGTAGSRRVEGHARAALLELDTWTRRNAIINDATRHSDGQPWDATRIRNLLGAEERELRIAGLRGIADLAPELRVPLYDDVEKALQSVHAKSFGDDDDDAEDVAAWYCRVLGESRDARYEQTLRTVSTAASSPKLRRYAEAALATLASAAPQAVP